MKKSSILILFIINLLIIVLLYYLLPDLNLIKYPLNLTGFLFFTIGSIMHSVSSSKQKKIETDEFLIRFLKMKSLGLAIILLGLAIFFRNPVSICFPFIFYFISVKWLKKYKVETKH